MPIGISDGQYFESELEMLLSPVGTEKAWDTINDIFQGATQPKFGMPEGQKDVVGEKKMKKDWNDSVPLKSFVPNSFSEPMDEIKPDVLMGPNKVLKEQAEMFGVKA